MDPDEQVGGESNCDSPQHRGSSREIPPMRSHGRHPSPEQGNTGISVEQEHEPPSISPESQAQSEHANIEIEEDDPQDHHQQAGAHQGNDPSDRPEGSSDESDENEDGLSDDERFKLIRKELSQNTEHDAASENGDELDDILDQGCGSCKIWGNRFARKVNEIMNQDRMITSQKRRLTFLMKQLDDFRSKLRKTKKENRRLRALLRRSGIDPESEERVRSVPNPNATTRMPSRAWKKDLRDFYGSSSSHDESEVDEVSWEQVWKAQYRQGNIPINLNLLHPDIRLKDCDTYTSPNNDSDTSGHSEIPRFGSHFTSKPPRRDFNGFNKLPETILLNILGRVLFFSGRIVHCFSRLDPFEPPEDFDTAEQVPGRIYISNGKRTNISLTHDTVSPQELLSPLLVNRKWYFFGAHIFYGKNTFAFSSFGEFGRFCGGIGTARLQRIAHLELHWQGGSCKRFEKEDEGRGSKKSKSYRSMPLAFLPEMKRLDTLVIHIDESQTRRPREAKNLVEYAAAATEHQPNYRMKRALRVCHGWDYLHMLRNMSWIRLYDTAKMNDTHRREMSAVQDYSAVLDLNETAHMRNIPRKAAECRLVSLSPLFPYIQGKWAPRKNDFVIILRILDRPQLRHNDLDVYSSESEIENNFGRRGRTDDSSTSDDSSDDGDDEGGEDDEGEDGKSEDGGSEDGGSEDGESEDGGSEDGGSEDDDEVGGSEDVRRARTEDFVRAQGGGSPAGFTHSQTIVRLKSEAGGSDLSPPASDLRKKEVIVIEDSEDEVQIIEKPRPRNQDRRRRLSSGLFVTPGAEERLTSASASFSPCSMVTTKLSIGVKRSASADPVEIERKRMKADI